MGNLEERRPELVVGAYVLWGKNILLVRKHEETEFIIPGGHVKFQEKIEKALMREVFEETGVRIKIDQFFRNIELINKQTHLFCVDYICSPRDDNPGRLLSPPDYEEIDEALWMNINEAVKTKNVASHIREGLQQILAKKALKF